MNEPRFNITITDMGGWARVMLGRGEVARFLSQSLTEWMRNNPHLRVRFIVPICSGGDTVELHAWYDQVSLADPGPRADTGSKMGLD